jgi:hypothetical protein
VPLALHHVHLPEHDDMSRFAARRFVAAVLGGAALLLVRRLIQQHGEIKWFHLISNDWTKSSGYLAMGWKNNDFTASSLIMERLTGELAWPKYLHSSGKSLLKNHDHYR